MTTPCSGREFPRAPDWEPRLAAVIDRWRSRPHGWDATCGDLAADVVEAVTGRDVRSQIGLPVRSAREAAALYRAAGVTGLAGAVTSVLGAPVTPRLIGRGDLVEASDDAALGVCVGSHAWFVGDAGLELFPLVVAGRGWKL